MWGDKFCSLQERDEVGMEELWEWPRRGHIHLGLRQNYLLKIFFVQFFSLLM